MQKIIYSGKDFPKSLPFRDQAIAFYNARKDFVYDLSLRVAEYAFDQTKRYEPGYAPSCVAGYKLFEIEGPCHSIFSKASDKTTTCIINMLTRNTHQSLSRPFLEFLLSPTESPWRSVLQDLYVMRDKGNDSYPIGFIFPDLNAHNIHVVTNFIIATRLNSSWVQGPIWSRLVELGFTKEEALVLGPNFYCYPNEIDEDFTDVSIFKSLGRTDKYRPWLERSYYQYQNRGYVSGDMPFNSYVDPWKVINAQPTPKGDKVSWADGASANPCNYIWDKKVKEQPTFQVEDLLGFSLNKWKDVPKATVHAIQDMLNTRNYEGMIILK